MARRRTPFIDQAELESLVRFGPEISGLLTLQREAEDRYRGDVRTARTTGRTISRAVKQARPQVRDIYDDAGQTVANVNAVTQLPEGMPASAAAAIAQEQSGFQRRMAESGATALTDLQSRGVAAREGQAFAVQQARGQLAKDLTSLLNRRLDLAREQGAYTALTARTLRQDAQQRADTLLSEQARLTQSERNSLRSAGIDPNSGTAIPGGRLDSDANGKPGNQGSRRDRWASQAAQAKASDVIGDALHHAEQLKSGGASRAAVAKALLEGRDEQPVYRIVENPNGTTKREPVLNDDGTPKLRPGVPKIDSELYLTVALDMAYDQHLSRRTQKLLHDRGIRVGPLGVVSYGDWRKRQRGGRFERPALAPGANGQLRPT